jgi:hypothetical protein
LIPAAHRIAREARGPRDLLRLRLRLVGKRVSCLNSLERIREKYHVSRRDELDPWYQQQVDVYDTQIALVTQQIHDVEATLHPHLIPNADFGVHNTSCIQMFLKMKRNLSCEKRLMLQ